MGSYRNNINTYQDLASFNSDNSKQYPNISYIIADDEVKWSLTEPLQNQITAVYDVVDTSSPTVLLNNSTNVTKMKIDGVEQQNVVTSHQFSTTGEHTAIFYYENQYPANNQFMGVSTLESVEVGEGILSATMNMFKDSSVQKIVLPSTLTSLSTDAFYGVVADVKIKATTPPTISENTFNNSTLAIYVPEASLVAYQTATNWSTLNDEKPLIPYFDEYYDGLTVVYLVSDHTQEVSLFSGGGSSSGSSSSESGGGGALPSSMLVDGVSETPPINSFRFTTDGYHIVKYTFEDNTVPQGFIDDNIGAATEVIVGTDITNIASGAFDNSLTSATCLSTTPPTIEDSSTFGGGGTQNYPIYVPAESVNTYKTASVYWEDFVSRIEAIQE